MPRSRPNPRQRKRRQRQNFGPIGPILPLTRQVAVIDDEVTTNRFSQFNRRTRNNEYSKKTTTIYPRRRDTTINNNNYLRLNNKRIIQYREDEVYALQNKIRTKLSAKVLSILFTDCSIRRSLNSQDIAKYAETISKLDETNKKKKIKSLCNKIGDKTYQKISTKLLIILNNNKDVFQYIIETIVCAAQNLLIVQNKNETHKYTQLKYYAHVCTFITKTDKQKELAIKIFNKSFDEIINDNKISSNNELELYVKHKNSYINLFIFFAALFNTKFLNESQIIQRINYLYKKILISDKTLNDTQIQAFCEVIQHTNKQFINYKQIQNLLNKSKYSMKAKFELVNAQEYINKI